jgi:hypothetical protein
MALTSSMSIQTVVTNVFIFILGGFGGFLIVAPLLVLGTCIYSLFKIAKESIIKVNQTMDMQMEMDIMENGLSGLPSYDDVK